MAERTVRPVKSTSSIRTSGRPSMSNGKSDLFVFLGAAFATLFGLFTLQKWYGSYIDIRFNQELQQGGPSEALVSARRADEEQAAKRKLPIDQAITRLAQRGRDSFSAITPAPSQDLSAVAGWIHRPGFKPVMARSVSYATCSGAGRTWMCSRRRTRRRSAVRAGPLSRSRTLGFTR